MKDMIALVVISICFILLLMMLKKIFYWFFRFLPNGSGIVYERSFSGRWKRVGEGFHWRPWFVYNSFSFSSNETYFKIKKENPFNYELTFKWKFADDFVPTGYVDYQQELSNAISLIHRKEIREMDINPTHSTSQREKELTEIIEKHLNKEFNEKLTFSNVDVEIQ